MVAREGRSQFWRKITEIPQTRCWRWSPLATDRQGLLSDLAIGGSLRRGSPPSNVLCCALCCVINIIMSLISQIKISGRCTAQD